MKKGDSVTIIGVGVSGIGLVKLAKNVGMKVFVSEIKDSISNDQSKQLKELGVDYELGGHTERALECDFVLLSSGVSPRSQAVLCASQKGVPCIGELDFVSKHLSSKLIGITGSNGKTTTTSLVAHILNGMGVSCAATGNIGKSIADYVGTSYECLAVELSSFQLFWANHFQCDVAVVTNIAPDHIDWHGSFDDYVASKRRLLSLQGPEGWGIVQKRDRSLLGREKNTKTLCLSWESNDNPWDICMEEKYAYLNTHEQRISLFSYENISLVGNHNMENVAMACAAVWCLTNRVSESKTLATFTPLHHRCEIVGEIDGVLYIDDSKGTNVAASSTAMESIKGRKIVILGGQGKGEDYAPLAKSVVREAEWVVLLGAEADKIELALREELFNNVYRATDMDEAVRFAKSIASCGMVVLLSPACTSWDMYPNYKVRGEHFKQAVLGTAK
ncbi:MAG: UDP-N-acetylmuramoyl-L-alanine--D-glutamate ligase [Smithella sp.]